MAVRVIEVPECDVCGELWLPDKRLPDGSINPARKNPKLCKRCGKCKSPRWNFKEKLEAKQAKRKVEEEAKAARKVVSHNPRRSKSVAGRIRKLCRHQLLNCSVCSKE